ncbi:MAG: tRNA (guanosine(46)-N7)-methyltransferase TrmB [Muribaculaceae bacterium]|nr:tRNA (guanosine(46)-N7)-methyltransferase TrmB [Muribaculaceae bacterium]
MGKNKLAKFARMEELPNVLQYPYGRLRDEGFPYRGRWHEFFGNTNPIVLELGCGKGEYTVGMARLMPDRNFVGVDIKGARMYTGATEAHDTGIGNAAFLRTSIELLDRFFAPGEVSEIWITFPDPQMRKVNKRLTGTRLTALYRSIAGADATVNLKTDSPFLYAYTRMMAQSNGLTIEADTDDLHGAGSTAMADSLRNILTHYERQWLARGLTIKYLRYRLGDGVLEEPEDADSIADDTYRSYSRGYIQMPAMLENNRK